MINFSEHNTCAQQLAIHYARELDNNYALKVMSGNTEITTPEEAVNITRFYWTMVDLVVEDENLAKEFACTTELEFWMEKLLNILMAYLNQIGLEEYWTKVTNEIKGR